MKKILLEIKAARGSVKKTVLEKYKGSDTLMRILYLATSNKITFGIKKIPDYVRLQTTITLPEALEELKPLISREVTGDAAIGQLTHVLGMLNEDDAFVLERIIDKNLQIGLQANSINKVIPGLIEKTSYQGCQPFSKKKILKILENGPALLQTKEDGFFLDCLVGGDFVGLSTRSGEIINLGGAAFVNELEKIQVKEPFVLNGELLLKSIPKRSIANGILLSVSDILTKAGERTQKETDKKIEKLLKDIPEELGWAALKDILDDTMYSIWDLLTKKAYDEEYSEVRADERFLHARALIEKFELKSTRLVDWKIVTTYSEAMEYFQQKLSEGKEGAVIKQKDSPWRSGKHSNNIKLKLEMESEMIIVGFQFGKTGTKNENVYSSLHVESSDGIVTATPSGMTEKLMDEITADPEKYRGAIVTVKCYGLSENKEGEKSMMSPSVVEIRRDRTEADNYEEILAIENAAKGLQVSV